MMRGEARSGRREGGAAAAAQVESRRRGRVQSLFKVGTQEIGGAHVEHAAHGCDAGRVEAQRLVESRGLLPSRKEGIPCGARCRTRGRRAVRRRRRMQRPGKARARLEGLGRRKLAERT